MIPTGKCPKCEKVPSGIFIEDITIRQQFSMSGGLNGVSYLCNHCKTILGVAMDPVDLKADIVRDVCQALGVTPKKKM